MVYFPWFREAIPKSSILERRYRYHKHPVRPLVGRIGQTAQDTQNCGRLTLEIRLKLLFDRQQVFRRGIDLIGAQLNLEGAPLAVQQLDHGIYLLIFIVLVVI